MSEPRLPTTEDIKKLPRWAQVAFAARCAWRAMPMYMIQGKEARKHFHSIFRTTRLVESTANFFVDAEGRADIGDRASSSGQLTCAIQDVEFAAQYAEEPSQDRSNSVVVTEAAYAAYAASYAAKVARSACSDTLAIFQKEAYMAVGNAMGCAVRAKVPVCDLAHDFQRTLDFSQRENWSDDTPVAPYVYGPVLDLNEQLEFKEEGKIEVARPNATLEIPAIKIEFEIPDDWTDQMVEDHWRKLVLQANRVHRAAGGPGLVAGPVEIEEFATVNLPAGGR